MWHFDLHGGPATGCRDDAIRGAEPVGAVAHRGQAEARGPLAIGPRASRHHRPRPSAARTSTRSRGAPRSASDGVASCVQERLARDAPHLVRGVRVHDDVVVEVEYDVAAVALLDVAAQLRDHTSEPAITLVPVGRDDAARLSERAVGRLMQLGQLLVVVAAARREAALRADVGEFLGQAVVDLRRDAPALVARRVPRLAGARARRPRTAGPRAPPIAR